MAHEWFSFKVRTIDEWKEQKAHFTFDKISLDFQKMARQKWNFL